PVRTKARRLDVNEGRGLSRDRAAQQPFDKQRRERRGHDGQLQRAGHGAFVVAEQGGCRRMGVGLGRRKEVIGLRPVGLVRVYALYASVVPADDEEGATSAPSLRKQK